MKKVLASLLALALMLSCSTAIFAAGVPTKDKAATQNAKFLENQSKVLANIEKRISSIDGAAAKAKEAIDKLNARKLPEAAIPVKDQIVALIEKRVTDTADLKGQIKEKLLQLKATLTNDQLPIADKQVAMKTINAEIKTLDAQVKAIVDPISEQLKAKYAELKSIVKANKPVKGTPTFEKAIASIQKRIDNIDSIASKTQAAIDKLNARKLPEAAIPVKDQIVALIQKKVADTADLRSAIKDKLISLKATLTNDQISVDDKKAAIKTINAEIKTLDAQIKAITGPISEQLKAKYAELKSIVGSNKPVKSPKPAPTTVPETTAV